VFHSRSNSIVPFHKQVFIHTLKTEIGLEELKLLNESLCVDPWAVSLSCCLFRTRILVSQLLTCCECTWYTVTH